MLSLWRERAITRQHLRHPVRVDEGCRAAGRRMVMVRQAVYVWAARGPYRLRGGGRVCDTVTGCRRSRVPGVAVVGTARESTASSRRSSVQRVGRPTRTSFCGHEASPDLSQEPGTPGDVRRGNHGISMCSWGYCVGLRGHPASDGAESGSRTVFSFNENRPDALVREARTSTVE